MFVTRKIWAITVPCIVLFCFSNPVRGEADSVSWENLSEHLAQESIPLLQLNVSNCPNKIENLEPSRVVAQIIENTFYLWEEYDILTEEGVETLCIVMKKPNPGSLSKEESQILLTASSLWKESKPRPEDVMILDANDPRLNLPPIESFLGDEGQSFEPENVIGTDNRTRITDTTSYPWNTHCYLELYFPAYSARGTGCLVSPYMVLTCGHNVYDQDYSDFVTNVTIAPGQKQSYEGGSVTRPYGTREGVDFQTNSGYIGGGSWEHDYSAVFFSTPFSGINTFMPLEWSGPSVGETVYLAGYAADVQGETDSQALWNDSDPVHAYTTSTILRYTIDTSGGQSGSPVLKKNYVMDPGRIIAIHAFGNATANGGPRLRSDNQALITEWMQWTPPCSPPTVVEASDGTYTDKVQITWDTESSPCYYYRVYRAASSTGTKTALGSGCQTLTTFNDTSATPGTTYYYWVKNAKDSSCSGASEYSPYNTGWRKLSSPTGVSASDGTYPDKVCITWNGVSGATYYQVYRDTSPTGTKPPLSNWQILTSYCDYTAELGITYYYWVKAAVGSDGSRASDYSAYDTGWRSVTHTLTVASSDPNSGVSITVSPSDNNSQGNGVTQFTRTYNNNTVVTLTAPSTVDGNSFKEWQLNDAYWTDALTANVTMDADYTLTAVYEQILLGPMTVDLNNNGIPNFYDFSYFAMFWLDTSCSSPSWCEGRDFDHDGVAGIDDLQIFAEFWLWPVADVDLDGAVNFTDYAIFAYNWMDDTCCDPNWCEGTDFDHSGSVDMLDLAKLAEYWLSGAY